MLLLPSLSTRAKLMDYKGIKAGALRKQRDRVGREVGRGFRIGGTHVKVWPIQVDV